MPSIMHQDFLRRWWDVLQRALCGLITEWPLKAVGPRHTYKCWGVRSIKILFPLFVEKAGTPKTLSIAQHNRSPSTWHLRALHRGTKRRMSFFVLGHRKRRPIQLLSRCKFGTNRSLRAIQIIRFVWPRRTFRLNADWLRSPLLAET